MVINRNISLLLIAIVSSCMTATLLRFTENDARPQISRRDRSFNLTEASEERASTVNTTKAIGESSETVNQGDAEENPGWYAVYSSNTPDGSGHRPYDYAFYWPLTALAWQRIGYNSVVVIIGTRNEWEQNKLLHHVLTSLEMRAARVIFVDAAPVNRRMLSQTVRLFVANMGPWADRDDYLITSDSDLWPLHQGHYTPEANKSLVLMHSGCCGSFEFRNKSYPMLPMGHIGANASTWRDIVNFNRPVAKDSESILSYFEEMFGSSARGEVAFASTGWFFDQQMINIGIQEWIDRYSNDLVCRKSDGGFGRIDRSKWNITQTSLETYYDAHLPHNGYTPEMWEKIKPLVALMFGNKSWQFKWADEYAVEFHQILQNDVNVMDPTTSN